MIVLYETLYPQTNENEKKAGFRNVMIVSAKLFTVAVILKGQTAVIHQCNILDIEKAINEFCTVRIQCSVQLIETCQ